MLRCPGGRPGPGREGLGALAGQVRGCRTASDLQLSRGPLPGIVVEDLVQVVHRPEEFDLGVDGGDAASVHAASEALEQLVEAWFDEGAAAGVELLAFGGCQPGGHLAVTGGDVVPGWRARVGRLVLLGDRHQQREIGQGCEVRGAGIAAVGQPCRDGAGEARGRAVVLSASDDRDQGGGVGGLSCSSIARRTWLRALAICTL